MASQIATDGARQVEELRMVVSEYQKCDMYKKLFDPSTYYLAEENRGSGYLSKRLLMGKSGETVLWAVLKGAAPKLLKEFSHHPRFYLQHNAQDPDNKDYTWITEGNPTRLAYAHEAEAVENACQPPFTYIRSICAISDTTTQQRKGDINAAYTMVCVSDACFLAQRRSHRGLP